MTLTDMEKELAAMKADVADLRGALSAYGLIERDDYLRDLARRVASGDRAALREHNRQARMARKEGTKPAPGGRGKPQVGGATK